MSRRAPGPPSITASRGLASPPLTMTRLAHAIARAFVGVAVALRRRPGAFLMIAAGVFALNVLLPPLLLAVVRTPWTYFTFNPWLKRLPEFLVSDAPLEKKLDFLSRVAVFWFTADGPYGLPARASPLHSPDLAPSLA